MSQSPSQGTGTPARLLYEAVASRWFRVLLATFGGYAFTAGYFAFASVLLALLGVSRVEAMWWGVLTSFLVFTVVVVWVVATLRPAFTTVIVIVSSFIMINGAPRLVGILT
ncbi:MAG: hypothetical protein AAGI88_12195 [Pseudomonadota bacterium]